MQAGLQNPRLVEWTCSTHVSGTSGHTRHWPCCFPLLSLFPLLFETNISGTIRTNVIRLHVHMGGRAAARGCAVFCFLTSVGCLRVAESNLVYRYLGPFSIGAFGTQAFLRSMSPVSSTHDASHTVPRQSCMCHSAKWRCVPMEPLWVNMLLRLPAASPPCPACACAPLSSSSRGPQRTQATSCQMNFVELMAKHHK